ncbi:hypothetical protein Sjap_005725 [Stephania japonica]|uniref:Uncharacterized protein n=1 Tax=Stephania japonica TaxID=461633 RepID=A0AAP0PJ32_9MAGN
METAQAEELGGGDAAVVTPKRSTVGKDHVGVVIAGVVDGIGAGDIGKGYVVLVDAFLDCGGRGEDEEDANAEF